MSNKSKRKAIELDNFIQHIFSDGEPHEIEEVARRAKISYDKAAGYLFGKMIGSEQWNKVWKEDNSIWYIKID